MENTELRQQLKSQIIKFLNLTDLKPEDIKDNEPLFGEGLGLDSIDSLELIVLMKKEYGIDIRDPREGRKVLIDIATMADYIQRHKK
jgi:acyl carrier protein